MSLSVVKTYAVSGSGSATLSATITAPAPGNALIAFAARPSGTTGAAMTGMSGGGVTWGASPDSLNTAITGDAELWSGLNSSGSGTTVTATFASGYGLHELFVIEVAGMVTTGTPTDGVGNNSKSSGGSTTYTSCLSAFTPSAGVDVLIVAGFISATAFRIATPPSGFTAIGTGVQGQAYYKIITGPSGSYNPTVTATTPYASFNSAAAAYKSAGGGAPPAPNNALFFC